MPTEPHRAQCCEQQRDDQADETTKKTHAFVYQLSAIKTIIASFTGNPHFDKSYAVNLNHAHEELQDLIQRVTIELELLNVVKELER